MTHRSSSPYPPLPIHRRYSVVFVPKELWESFRRVSQCVACDEFFHELATERRFLYKTPDLEQYTWRAVPYEDKFEPRWNAVPARQIFMHQSKGPLKLWSNLEEQRFSISEGDYRLVCRVLIAERLWNQDLPKSTRLRTKLYGNSCIVSADWKNGPQDAYPYAQVFKRILPEDAIGFVASRAWAFLARPNFFFGLPPCREKWQSVRACLEAIYSEKKKRAPNGNAATLPPRKKRRK